MLDVNEQILTRERWGRLRWLFLAILSAALIGLSGEAIGLPLEHCVVIVLVWQAFLALTVLIRRYH